MREKHIEFDRLLDIAVDSSDCVLHRDESRHLDSCRTCREKIERYRRSFEGNFQGDVPPGDIERFRESFLNAWDRRNDDPDAPSRFKIASTAALMKSVVKKPSTILFAVLFSMCLFAGGAYVVTLINGKSQESRPVILMDGQRLIHRPELLPLFPAVDNPTLISTDHSDGEDEVETFSVHGYLEGESVQIVWQL